ncbi:MAG TPA: hypothetical protein ENH12_05830, partial [Proteobacteria bacterium]|nr:hypothetical protein [Pseudomonadota bacterium]
SYIAIILAAGLAIGLITELIRRIFRAGFAVHIIVATVLLVTLAVYLCYGVAGSDLDKVDPSQGLPDGYHPPLVLWWGAIGIAALGLAVAAGSVTGFFRKDDKAIPWLVVLVPGLAAFNIAEQSIGVSLPHLWLAVIILAGVVSFRIVMRFTKLSLRRLIAAVGIIAGVALIGQGAYFGWPGTDYDRHLSLMIWDAQPAERMNLYGYEALNTPNLSALRDQMVLFEEAHSPANYTFPSHVSIFTGRYLREHHLYDGNLEESKTYDGFNNITDIMRRKGYRSLMLTENPWLIPISRGFDAAISCPTRGQGQKYFMPFYRDTFLARQVIDQITFSAEGEFKWTVLRIEKRRLYDWLLRARRNGPYFICTNWMYFHSRYSPSVDPSIPHQELPQKAYDDCIRFMDSYLKEWLGIFRASGQYNNSLFLLTADHGDFLGQWGMYGHGKTLLEPVLHVPLVLFGDDVEAEVVSPPVPLVALKSALGELVPDSPGSRWNISGFIKALLNNRGAVSEGSFDFEGPDNSIRWFLATWEGKEKYIQDNNKYIPGYSKGLDMDSFYFLYDLKNDPGEKDNLASRRPAEVVHMQERITEWESRLKPVPLPPPAEGEEDEYPPGLVEQLRALGYMR